MINVKREYEKFSLYDMVMGCMDKANECLVIDTTGKESGHSEILIIYLFAMQASCVSSDC